jgi:hypothetical protein
MTTSTTVGRRLVGGACIVAAGVSACVPPVRPTPLPGLTYTVTFAGNQSQMRGGQGTDTTVSVEQFAGDAERLDIRHQSSSAVIGGDSLARTFGNVVGLYTLRKRGSATLTVVDTAKRQYFAYDQDSAMRGIMQQGPKVEVLPGDTAFATRVQPDTIIDGLHAEHWRLTTHATMHMAIVGDVTLGSTIDTYIATGTTDMRFKPPGRGQQAYFAGEAYARKQEEARATLPHGLEVLTVTQSVVDAGGVHRATTQMSRLSDIQNTDIPAEVFAIPAGYKRVATPAILGVGKPRVRGTDVE